MGRPVTEAWLRSELERIHSRLRAEDRKQRAAARDSETRAKVAAYLADHPDATANAVWREIGGRRGEVLQAVKDARNPVPASGYRQESGGPE